MPLLHMLRTDFFKKSKQCPRPASMLLYQIVSLVSQNLQANAHFLQRHSASGAICTLNRHGLKLPFPGHTEGLIIIVASSTGLLFGLQLSRSTSSIFRVSLMAISSGCV